ncbi:MAG: proline dehydrogenase family protein [Acidobacteriota bacterium]|mgnify:CR=1 FL=1|nr:proline dehydrogenase family protein [Acidobacteriota bacterium]HNZ97067.1 proline dehydrogenase family protein [Thermoanaerobaculia bacterium]
MSLFHKLIVLTMPLVPKFIVGRVASRYVAGEGIEDALREIARLNAEGAMATMDLLGEEVYDPAKAEANVREYQRMLKEIAERKLDANISIKPTALGLKINRELFESNLDQIATSAAEHGNFVRIDMEDHTTIDDTLAVFRSLRKKHDNLGVVFQAYMRRTLADIEALPAEGANIRLCKGIYIEPRAVAWKGFETVQRAFLAALEKAFRQGVYVGIATHDEYLCCAAVHLIDRLGIPRDRYEFQMLLGVEPLLRRILVEGGHRLRVYVPYGKDWYPYSTRRLRENPEVAGHIIRAFFSRS